MKDDEILIAIARPPLKTTTCKSKMTDFYKCLKNIKNFIAYITGYRRLVKLPPAGHISSNF